MASNNSDPSLISDLDIRVSAVPRYLPAHSSPEHEQFRFAYRIHIENRSDQTVTLLRRFWKICDANGKVDEVEGAGVVGETPTLKPGDYYDCSSAANFETPIGFMEGYYTFQILDQMGEFPNTCTVPIPRFTLAKPNALH